MGTATPEARRTSGRKLGCLTAVLVVGSIAFYAVASFDFLPRRAFSRAHERIRAGQSLPEAAGVLLALMQSRGFFEVSQTAPGGEKRVLLSRGERERPSAEALAARIDRGLPIQVRMITANLSGRFTIALEADGTVREVSTIDGYVK